MSRIMFLPAILCFAFDVFYIFTAGRFLSNIISALFSHHWEMLAVNGILFVLMWLGMGIAILAGIGGIMFVIMAIDD